YAAQTLDSTAKQKIATEPAGATNIFSFIVKPIFYTSSRVSIWRSGVLFLPVFDLSVIPSLEAKDQRWRDDNPPESTSGLG
ncbi:MAG: hypothetical protein L3J62_05655, partial [Gammaproteobacteria bacterium]|nr:hypothetical protein [Gammaproteobacteria bacterium]